MAKKYKFLGLFVLAALFASVMWLIIQGKNHGILAPSGVIATRQAEILYLTAGLSLIVVIPVFILTFWFAYKYREGNKNAKYAPELSGNTWLEIIWWGIPLALITFLAVVTYNTSHSLDPFKPLDSSKQPLNIQVIALQWRWLFIYPEQKIASVNYFYIPTDRPVKFSITSDAPMNSFWIPQLGGQIYAMSGMKTDLNLNAEKPGVYEGSSANISGQGFANMRFKVQAGSDNEFGSWVSSVKKSGSVLTLASYGKLSQPSQNTATIYYGQAENGIFDNVIMKYMMPMNDPRTSR